MLWLGESLTDRRSLGLSYLRSSIYYNGDQMFLARYPNQVNKHQWGYSYASTASTHLPNLRDRSGGLRS